MDEEPAPKPKHKLPLFLIVILGIFGLLALVMVSSIIFDDPTFFKLLHSNVIVSNIFSKDNPSSARCKIYAEQFGVTNSSNCISKDRAECFALCTAHFECCEY